MSAITIYHNARCSKSRQTLQLLQDNGIEPSIIEYLKTPLNAEQISEILKKLKCTAHQLMRTKENEYKALAIDPAIHSEQQLIEFMVATPKLIERPIVVNGDKAAIGRPPEQVLEIF